MMSFYILISLVPLIVGLTKFKTFLKMNGGIQRVLPSVQFKQTVGDEIGDSWSYTDLFEKSSKKMVEAVSITSDKTTAIAIDNQHGEVVEKANLHVIKIFPENIDTLVNKLVDNHVNVDLVDTPKSEIFNFFYRISEALYTIMIYYLAISLVLTILSSFVKMPGPGGTNLFNPLSSTKKNDLIDASNLNTTFADVAGCDEAKFELMEVVDFLKDKGKYEAAGAKIPKGVLLEGSPGTGKTLLARAVAGEAGVPFISASGSEFIELYVGIGASRVRDLFDKAKENSPCVIFIDEIDAVGRKRGAGIAGGNDEREQTLNQILTNMDGFTISDGIVVIAATNRIDVLDNALIRPGRFDRKVKVGLPDKEGREKIFNVHLKNKKLGEDFDIKEIVSLTNGFSGADISNLVNEAAIYSVRANNTLISQKNFMDAYEKITIGIPSKNENTEVDEIKLVSYHEVGHAFLVGYFRDMFDLRKVTIKENKNGAGGYTLFTPKDKFTKYASKKFILANLIISMGGRAAEVYLYKKNKRSKRDNLVFKDFKNLEVTTGATNDLKQANELARKYITEYGFGENLCYIQENENNDLPFVSRDINRNKDGLSDEKKCNIDNQVEYLVNYSYEMALKIIESNDSIFESIVDILTEKKIINGVEVLDLMKPIENENKDF